MAEKTGNALQHLYENRPDFNEFFRVLCLSNRSAITVDSFLKAPEIDKATYSNQELAKKAREFFRELDGARLGKFIIGRRGSKSRFVWTVSLGEVNKVIEELKK